jgi:hypothetical protein
VRAAVAVLGALLAAGCTAPAPAGEQKVELAAGVREDTRMTQVVLDQVCLGLGERYVTVVGNACSQVERSADRPERRARAHSFKLQNASSVYDILTGPNPFAKLMDLLLLAELQHRVWAADRHAAEVFGAEAAAPLAAALARGREDAWAVSDQVLKPDQRRLLEGMIDEWRKANPSAEAVAFVRFNDFAEFRGKSILDGVPLGSGLLAPVSEATRQLEETRLLAERGLFLAKRMPLLARWHAESYLNTVLVKPEIQKLSDAAVRAVNLAETLPARVAEERAAVVKLAEEHEKALGKIAGDVRATAADARLLVKETEVLLGSARETIQAADGLAKRFDTQGQARPFDVREYIQALQAATKAIAETQALLKESGALLESPAWTKRVDEVSKAAHDRMSHAADEARRITDYITIRAAGLMVLGLVLALLYRFLSPRERKAP